MDYMEAIRTQFDMHRKNIKSPQRNVAYTNTFKESTIQKNSIDSERGRSRCMWKPDASMYQNMYSSKGLVIASALEDSLS